MLNLNDFLWYFVDSKVHIDYTIHIPHFPSNPLRFYVYHYLNVDQKNWLLQEVRIHIVQIKPMPFRHVTLFSWDFIDEWLQVSVHPYCWIEPELRKHNLFCIGQISMNLEHFRQKCVSFFGILPSNLSCWTLYNK